MITLQWKELSHYKRIPRNARREPRWFQGRGIFARFVQDHKRFCSMTIKAPTRTSISCEKEALVFFFLGYIPRRRDEHVSSVMTGRKSFWSRVYEKPVSLRFFREFEWSLVLIPLVVSPESWVERHSSMMLWNVPCGRWEESGG